MENYIAYSHFCKYIAIDICHICGCLSSHKQLFYVWRHSCIVTTSSPTLKPELKFLASLTAGMQAHDFSSINQMYWGTEFVSEGSKVCKQFLCKAFCFNWMADVRGPELFGVQGEVGCGGSTRASSSSSSAEWFGGRFPQLSHALSSQPYQPFCEITLGF